MNLQEIQEILRLHNMWVNCEEGGERADLRCANLSGADLRCANLHDARLRGANLSGADLCYSDLCHTDLRGANLSGADLTDSKLNDCTGNGKEVITCTFDGYIVVIYSNMMSVGCQTHAIEDWMQFDDETIAKMASNALEWWKKWKSVLQAIINAGE